MSEEFPEPEPEPEPNNEEAQPKPRRGRARERQERREARRQRQAQPRSATHLMPERAVKLPTIKIPRGGLAILAVIAAVVIIGGVVVFLRGLKPEEDLVQPHALWLGTEWTYEVQEPESIDSLVQLLNSNDIGTVYAWVSWLQEDRTWRGAENFTAVREFATQLKEAQPNVQLYGWVSFPVDLDEDGYRLDDEELQDNIADFSGSVVRELGYDGVFLNIEPVWDGNEDFLTLLRKVRASVGDNVQVSVAIPPDWSPEDAEIPVPPLIVPGTIWAKEYKQSVALLSNQMAVMAYNSGLSSADDYKEWMAYQVQTFAEAISEIGEGTELIFGIPTYDAEPPGHDPLVENVESALEGVTAGLTQAGDAANFVQGIAIYAEWTTDETEWEQFGAWLNNPG